MITEPQDPAFERLTGPDVADTILAMCEQSDDTRDWLRFIMCTIGITEELAELRAEATDPDNRMGEPISGELFDALVAAVTDAEQRGELGELRYFLSLCPVHGGDYASCFDDLNDECAGHRENYPVHDT